MTTSRDLRRQRLLLAGLEVFGTRGFCQSNRRQICHAAGLPRTDFQAYFADREALLLAVHQMVQSVALSDVRRALAVPGMAPRQRAIAAGRAYAFAVATDQRRAKVSFVEVAGVGDGVDEGCTEIGREWMRVYREAVLDLMSPGGAPPSGMDLAARGLIGSVSSAMRWWCLTDERPGVEQVADLLGHIALGSLGVDL
ncbi:MAG: TetR/AcrR family transcriptional regulator [Rhodococcus fascians]